MLQDLLILQDHLMLQDHLKPLDRPVATAPYGHPFTEDWSYQKNVGFCCILTLISGRGLVGDYLAVI